MPAIVFLSPAIKKKTFNSIQFQQQALDARYRGRYLFSFPSSKQQSVPWDSQATFAKCYTAEVKGNLQYVKKQDFVDMLTPIRNPW